MLILFIVFGAFFGAIAASTAVWLGGSVMLAFLSYSVFGSVFTMALAYAMFLTGELSEHSNDWQKSRKTNKPVSAY